ncbi:MAG: fatty acid desaturase [Opitutales bacterium]
MSQGYPTSDPPPTIAWYRPKIPRDVRKQVLKKSNLLGFLQAGGHLAIMATTGTLAFLAAEAGQWLWFALALFAHGTVCAFQINAVHELVHGTVFKTRWLNDAFARIFGFIGWNNPMHFWQSHTEHHKYTLHHPDDGEVVLPVKPALRWGLTHGIVNPKWLWQILRDLPRHVLGRWDGWQDHVLGDDNSAIRRKVTHWWRFVYAGHALILVVSLATGYWQIPILLSLTPMYGRWLFHYCNNSQHVGLVDDVPDFRLCCRTIKLDPFTQFLYWHMNYHTEHHMYASVPCYHLGKLHRAIKDDLPESKGLIGCWREVAWIYRKQQEDPDFQYYQPLPDTAHPAQLGDKPRPEAA